MLSSQELSRIWEREAQNIAYRARMRQKWAQARQPVVEEKSPPIQIDLGPDSKLIISLKTAVFKWGPLSLSLPRISEEEIRTALFRLQATARKWPDGTIRGLKRLVLRPDGRWESPDRHTLWENGECHEPSLALEAQDHNEALRGQAGIHAVWPDQPKELKDYRGRLVEVAGWGRCIVGDLGWRAEHARVVRKLL